MKNIIKNSFYVGLLFFVIFLCCGFILNNAYLCVISICLGYLFGLIFYIYKATKFIKEEHEK